MYTTIKRLTDAAGRYREKVIARGLTIPTHAVRGGYFRFHAVDEAGRDHVAEVPVEDVIEAIGQVPAGVGIEAFGAEKAGRRYQETVEYLRVLEDNT